MLDHELRTMIDEVKDGRMDRSSWSSIVVPVRFWCLCCAAGRQHGHDFPVRWHTKYPGGQRLAVDIGRYGSGF